MVEELWEFKSTSNRKSVIPLEKTGYYKLLILNRKVYSLPLECRLENCVNSFSPRKIKSALSMTERVRFTFTTVFPIHQQNYKLSRQRVKDP